MTRKNNIILRLTGKNQKIVKPHNQDFRYVNITPFVI